MTRPEVADALGMTPREVQSIEESAIRKCRRLLRANNYTPDILFNMRGIDGDGLPARTRNIQAPSYDE